MIDQETAPTSKEETSAIKEDGTPISRVKQGRRNSYSFVQRSATTEEILLTRKASFGPNCTLVMKEDPIQIVRGAGTYLYDESGREYLDTCNNVASVGHCHPVVNRAVHLQLDAVNTNFRYLHPLQVDVAETLLDTFKGTSLESGVIYMTNSGSEANDLAVRIAKCHFEATLGKEGPGGAGGKKGGRRPEFHIAVLGGAYHGHLVSTIQLSPYKLQGPGGGRQPTHVHVIPCPDVYRGLHLDGRSLAQAAVDEAKKAGGRIGMLIAEPLPSCAGQMVLPPGWLADVYNVMRGEGALCVSDEVQTGLGRLGTSFWGFVSHGAAPDMVSLGKGLGNGFPVAALVCSRQAAGSFDNGMAYFNTFGGCTAALAAAAATLRVLREGRLGESAAVVGEYLVGGLKDLQKKYPDILGDVRGSGLMLGVEVVTQGGTGGAKLPAPHLAKSIQARLRKRGVLISVDGPCSNVIKIKPPLCFSTPEADLLVLQCGAVLQDMKLEGMFNEIPADLSLSLGSVHGGSASGHHWPQGGEGVASGYQSRHSELSACPEEGPLEEGGIFGRTPHEIKALELKLLRELSDPLRAVSSPMTPKDLGGGEGGKGYSFPVERPERPFDTDSVSSFSTQRSGEGGGGGGRGPTKEGSRRASLFGGEKGPLPPLEEEERDEGEGGGGKLGGARDVEEWLLHRSESDGVAGPPSVLCRAMAAAGGAGAVQLVAAAAAGAAVGLAIGRLWGRA